MINVHHILLAAGESKRMGEPKQLLNWGNKNLIQYQIENILPTTKKLYVVIGAYSEIIEPFLKNYPIEVIRFSDWKKGMGESLSYSIKKIEQLNFALDGVLVSLVDQPLISSSHYLKMRMLFEKGKDLIIGSESNLGWKGVPILFDSNYFEQIKSLTGDKGARSVLQKNIHCAKFLEAGDNLIDIDTPECYEKYYKKFSPQ